MVISNSSVIVYEDNDQVMVEYSVGNPILNYLSLSSCLRIDRVLNLKFEMGIMDQYYI